MRLAGFVNRTEAVRNLTLAAPKISPPYLTFFVCGVYVSSAAFIRFAGELPAKMMHHAQQKSEPRFTDIPLSQRELPRILVADDDPVTAEHLASLTDGESYHVVRAKDGREAYRTLKIDAEFSAVIIDLTLPHLKGVEILRYMKTEKRLARIPVIIVSGDHSVRLVADSFTAGAIAFLPKPFAVAQLRRTLRMALASNRAPRRI